MKSVEDWLTAIDNGLEYRKKFAREEKWNNLEESWLNDPKSDTAIGPNLIYSMGDSLMSSLNVPDPEFTVTAEHPMGVDRAPVVEQVDNWLTRKTKLKRYVDMATLHCYLCGRGIVKVGYDSEFGWAPYYDIGTREQLTGVTLTQFNKKGERIEFKDTTPGMPWLSSVHPSDFVVPWGTIFLDDAPWAAHRIIRMNSFFKADPKYKNTSRLEPQVSMEDFMSSYSKVAGKDRMHYTTDRMMHANTRPLFNVAWEIHDRMSGKVIVVSPDYDSFLRKDNNALLVAGLPFVDIGFVTHPRSFWSTPQAYYLGQIQHIEFDISLQAEKQRRLNAWRLLARKGAMTSEQLDKLLSGGSGTVGLVDTNEPLSEIFMSVPQGNMMDFVIQSEHNKQAAREAIGYSRNQTGEYMGKTHITKGETDIVQKGSDTRAGRRFGAISTAYTDIIGKLNKICFSFWKLPRFAMVGQEWVKFTGEELQGDYLYDASLSTKRNLSRAERKVEALMLMAQFMQMGLASPELLQYAIDAANDPAFERIFASTMGKGGGQPAAQGASPSPSPAPPAGGK